MVNIKQKNTEQMIYFNVTTVFNTHSMRYIYNICATFLFYYFACNHDLTNRNR